LASTLITGQPDPWWSSTDVFGPPEELGYAEPAGPHPAETNPRREDFDRQVALEKKRDFVFLPGCSVKTMPVHGEKLKTEILKR